MNTLAIRSFYVRILLAEYFHRLGNFFPLLHDGPQSPEATHDEYIFSLHGWAAEGGRHQKAAAAAASDAAISHETFTITVVEEGERGINSE